MKEKNKKISSAKKVFRKENILPALALISITIITIFIVNIDVLFPKQTNAYQTQLAASQLTAPGEASDFVTCLANAGFRIYGANWCGYTKALVSSFGGFDAVSSIYVECTEQASLCNQERIQGYPTIKINGATYNGERTFAGFSAATGCAVTSEAVQTQPVQTASCGG